MPYYAYSYGYDMTGNNTRQSIFAQDAWHATNRLTLNVGVRGDFYQGKQRGGRQGVQQQQLGAAPGRRVRPRRATTGPC